MSIDAVFAQFFDDIPDPRQHAKIYYPFYDVLFSHRLRSDRWRRRVGRY